MENKETEGTTTERSWGYVIGTLIVGFAVVMTLSTILQLMQVPLFICVAIVIVVSNLGMRLSMNGLNTDKYRLSFWSAMKQS